MAATYPGTATGETDPIAEADLAAHVAAADPHTQYQKESEKAQANGYASLDGGGQVPLSQLGNAPAGGGGADASTTVKGISKLSTAPASPTNPIAVGDNDPRNSDQRVPTDGSVTAAKVNTALKPSGSAATTDEALRALGTGASTAAAGNDSRLSDARTPTAHAASHASAGSDPVTIAESQVTNLVTDLAAKAPLASPTFTGDPKAPTPSGGDNDTSIATTAFVQGEIAPKAPLASPALTGSPTAPTQTARDNSTKLATTAYADAGDQGVGSPNTQTANYTLVLGDAGKSVEMNSASATTLTVPPNSSVAFPVGTIIEVCRLGAGTVAVAAGAGVTIRSKGSLLSIGGQYSSVSLRKRATDEWVLVGDLA